MLGLPLSLWLTFTPVYLTNQGTGTEFGTEVSYEMSKRASLDFNLGSATTKSFYNDRNGSLDLDYSLIKDRLDVITGVGYDDYTLYGAGSPTITKDLHCRVKLKVF